MIYTRIFLLATALAVFGCNTKTQVKTEVAENGIKSYDELNKAILQGWNTWDNRDIMSQVLLPDGLALNLQIEDTVSGQILKRSFTGNSYGNDIVRTLAHTPDGSYTAFQVSWNDFHLVIQSVSDGNELDVLVSPKFYQRGMNKGYLLAEAYFPYGDEGSVEIENENFKIQTENRSVSLFVNGNKFVDGSTIKANFKDWIFFSTRPSSLEEIRDRIGAAEEAYYQRKKEYGTMSEVYNVIQNAINWTVVYDSSHNCAVTPVARTWSYGWGKQKPGGYIQFCWDNFFVSYMHAIESPELAYNEVLQLTRIIDELGFVPNFSGPVDLYSRDRSQPPVGGMMVKQIYKMHPNKWFLEVTFDQLLRWNRWWSENRDIDGYLAWGSNPFEPIVDKRQAVQNEFRAASYESGLDNTPMYEGVPFDTVNHVLKQADVGLMGLYIADCEAVAEMADILGRAKEAQELRERAAKYREKLKTLWNDDFGLFLNKRTDTGEWNYSISPTNFYALLGEAATQDQAERMMKEHFYNPEEFWGDYIMPSIARNDPGYTGRDYWRGSIWAPMNFLVYMGIRNYDLPQAQADLADRSRKLLLKNWEEHGFVLESYHGEFGTHPGYRAEFFYHWGALLGMINMIEHGMVPPTETSIYK